MGYVPIPKDLKKVKTKVAFNVTAILFLIVSTLPIFFVTLFEKDGLTFEKYFKHIYLHKFYQPQKRVRKEVYLEQEKKNTANSVRTKSKGIKGKQKKPEKRKAD